MSGKPIDEAVRAKARDLLADAYSIDPQEVSGGEVELVVTVAEALTAAQQQGQAVATVDSYTQGSYWRNYRLTWHFDVEAGTKLYTAPPPSVPEGWKLVPIIPTDGMLAAAIHARDERIQRRAQASGALVIGGQSAAYTFHDTYRAMLAAAPALAHQPAACGTCGEAIRPDATTGTTCRCAHQPAAMTPVCVWTEQPDGEAWDGGCGAVWQFMEGGPEDNDMRHCPQCGGRVEVATQYQEPKSHG